MKKRRDRVRFRYERLEDRRMLASDFDGQLVYVNFGGGKFDFNGPVEVSLAVPEFNASNVGLSGLEPAIIDRAMANLALLFDPRVARFTTQRPQDGNPYSTIFVGGDDDAFIAYGQFFGLAESNDFGNQNQSDEAIVFAEALLNGMDLRTVADAAVGLTLVIQHETKRLMGDAGYIATIPWQGGVTDVAMVDSDISRKNFLWPTLGNSGSSRVGHQTGSPNDHYDNAIDINQSSGRSPISDFGKPVYAAHDGILRILPPNNPNVSRGGYGYYARLESDNGYSTLYAHLDGSTDSNNQFGYFLVADGERVRQGQQIAWVGDSGTFLNNNRPDNVHLHWEYLVGRQLSTVSPVSVNDVRFSKGFFVPQSLNGTDYRMLSDSSVTFRTISNADLSQSNVVALRPSDSMHIEGQGFDWSVDAQIRLVDASGNVVLPPQTFVTSTAGKFGFEIPTASIDPGTYFLQGRETDWAQAGGYPVPWNNNGWQLGDTRPTTIVISRAAPSAAFPALINSLRSSLEPWTIYEGTLLVAGTTVGAGNQSTDRHNSDRISIVRSGQDWVLSHGSAEKVVRFPITTINSVFIDAGGGDDVIDLFAVDLPVTVIGGAGNDFIIGGQADDILVGGSGKDWIEGGQGRDWIFGGIGADILFGDDVIPPSSLQAASDRDHIFGEADDDMLFTRIGDSYHGGDGIDEIVGQFGAWTWPQVPPSHGGFVVLSANERSISVSSDGRYVHYHTPYRTLSFLEAAFNDTSLNETLVFGSSLIDNIDLFPSFTRSVIFGRGGGDQIIGSNFSDMIFESGGAGQAFGRGGADSLFGGSGGGTLYGESGDDSLFGGGSGQTLNGGQGRDYFLTGNGSDIVADATPVDIVGFAARRRQERLDNLNSTTSANTTRVVNTSVATSAPGIVEFSIDSNVITQGDGFVATVRTDRTGTWARMKLFADIDQNGRYDSTTDVLLARTRGRTADFRGHVRTTELSPGTYNLRVTLEAFDGTISISPALQFTVVAAPSTPPSLPERLSRFAGDATLIIPHKNGDAVVPNNTIHGPGQIDLYEITIGTTGNHSFSTTSVSDLETVRAIYDSAGERIGGPVAGGQALIVELTAGQTYTLAVAGRFAHDIGDYDLVIFGRNQISNGDIETPPGNFSGTVAGQFETGNTIDYWKIVAPQTASLLDLIVAADEGLELWIRVADTDNQVIGLANLASPGAQEILQNLPVTPGKTYYATLHGQHGTTGSYLLTADFYPDDPGLPNEIDVATALANYVPLIPHGDGDYVVVNQVLSQVGQFRYFHIAPTYSGTFIFRTTGSTDTQIGIYSGNGTQLLAFSDNDGSGNNGQVELDLIGAEEYWLVVRGAGNASGEFGVELIGPEQSHDPILVTGLARRGEDSFSLGVSSERQVYFAVIAPADAQTVDMSVWPTDVNRPLDIWWSIEDEEGIISVIDAEGLNSTESLTGFAVTPGKRYSITITSKDRAPGSARIAVDFTPDASGSGEFIVNSTITENQDSPNVAMNALGWSVAVWQSLEQNADDDIKFQIFNASGQPVGTEKQANAPDSFIYQSNPDVGMANDHSIWISWTDDSSHVRIRRFNSIGVALTAEIDTGLVGFEAKIDVLSDGTAMVLAGNGRQIFARAYAASGSPLSSIRVIDDPTGNDDAINLSIAAMGDTGFIASWTRESTGYDVVAQRLDTTANKVGSEIAAYNSTPGQFDSAVAATSDGRLAIAFRQNDSDGSLSNVYLVLIDANNNIVSPAKRVHEQDSGSQEHPSVFLKSDGSSLVNWTTPDLDGSGKGIFSRQFDAFGNPFLSEEFQLNEFFAGDQQRPAITGNGQDTFFAVWESALQDGNGTAVVGHRFDLPTPLPAPEITVHESSGMANDNLLEFGRHVIGGNQPEQSLIITNTGSALLTGSVQLTSNEFIILGNTTFALLPNETTTFVVQMATSSRGFINSLALIHHNASAQNPYEIVMHGSVSPAADGFEPNDSDESATDLGQITSTSLSGTIHQNVDTDWYQFTIPFYGQIDVSVEFIHTEGNIEIIAYDNHLGILAVGGSADDNETIRFFRDREEVAYLRVFANGIAINDYVMSITTTETNRAPLIDQQTVEVAENHIAGTFGTVVASDPDPGQTLTFSISGGTGAGLFEINPITGELSLASGVTLNYEATAWYTIDIQVVDSGNPSLTDSASVLINVENIAEVSAVVLGDGSNQRSRIETVTITFDNLVDFTDGDVAAAFTMLQNETGQGVDLVLDSVDHSTGVTVVRLRFSGSLTRGSMAALIDGNYRLDVDGSRFMKQGTATAGKNFTIGNNLHGDDRFYAFFGDVNGDRKVDLLDFSLFRQSFGLHSSQDGFNSLFDYYQDGVISLLSFSQFRSRFGRIM
jgi:murein DD-endopeptidase MepM/ murein hydrolase activator NlpD